MKPLIRMISLLLLAVCVIALHQQPVHAAGTSDFVITIKSDNNGISSDTEFTIPTHLDEIYNYNLDCDNDGNDEATGITGNYTCNYSVAGTYTIRIKDNVGDGTGFPRIYFNNEGDREKLISIDQWGTGKWISFGSAFYGCANLVANAGDEPDLSDVEDMSFAFALIETLNNLKHWDTSNVTNMQNLFSASYVNDDIGDWNTGNIINMESLFSAYTGVQQDLGKWDTSNVTNMSSMFLARECIPGSDQWDTSSVTDMSKMFFHGFCELDLGNWDTSSVTNMIQMFEWGTCPPGSDRWDTSSVTDMSYMFDWGICRENIGQWDTSSVTNMSYMFTHASFNEPIGNWDTSNVTDMSWMFYNCIGFNQPLDGWDTSNVTDMSGMFYKSEFNGSVDGWDTGNVTSMAYMFSWNSFNQDISSWDTSNVTTMVSMFDRNSKFNQDISGWDTSNVTDLGWMFYLARSFDQNLGNWDISNVINLGPFLHHAGLSTQNYDASLIGWATQILQPGLMYWADDLTYCRGEAARNHIISSYGWRILYDRKDCTNYVPALISPADGSIVGNINTTYVWNKVPDADRYTLEIWKIADDSVVHSARYNASVRCDDTTCLVKVPGTLNYEEYKWRVRSWVGSWAGGWSNFNTFFANVSPVQLRSPRDEGIIYGSRPTFKYYPLIDADLYDVEVYDSDNLLIGNWPTNGACNEICSSRLPKNSNLGVNFGDYQWRMRGRNWWMDGLWSDLRTFTYTQLERTVQVNPADGFATTDTTPEFQWGEITGATLYLFQVRLPDDTFVGNFLVSDATYCVDGGNCTWVIPDGILDPNTTYKWHVRAKNGRNFGRWTAYREIVITE